MFARPLSSAVPLALFAAGLLVLLTGCSGTPIRQGGGVPPVQKPGPGVQAPVAPSGRPGGYYLDDGPGDNAPADMATIPDAVPRLETPARGPARPYVAMGRSYAPMTALGAYKARGVASWYGRRYHGKATSSGETYDMYAMTAAHTILPIPSYARVTALATGRSVVVRINDRGPFHADRIIDLSYVAAWKLGLVGGGSGPVEVEALIPGSDRPPVRAEDVAASVATAPAAGDAGDTGVFLQLGAFGARDAADDFLRKMRVELDGVGVSPSIHARDNVFRVQSGPYLDRAGALAAAARIEQRLGLKPFVTVR